MTLATLLTAVVLQAIPFGYVAGGYLSQIDEARKVVVRTDAEWQALWKAHASTPAPKVDFSKSIVVGVFLGMRPTAGHTVRILRVNRTTSGADVEYVQSEPDRNGMSAQMLTFPFHLVSLPGDIKTVEFKQVVK
jgi:hypothetical protein